MAAPLLARRQPTNASQNACYLGTKKLDDLQAGPFLLEDPTNINIVVGRNGAGKSRFLRGFADLLDGNEAYRVWYVSPERAGVFEQEPGLESNLQRSPGYLRSIRNKNQASGFNNLSAYYLRQLETIFLRKLDGDPALRLDISPNFSTEHLEKINAMLFNVAIDRDTLGERVFVFRNLLGSIVGPDALSSSESEIFALASEVMYFLSPCIQIKETFC